MIVLSPYSIDIMSILSQKSKIFIAYRRHDSAGHAGRLYDRLSSHFGPDRVFLDIDIIKPGDDFIAVIEEPIVLCEVLIAIIGKQWLNSADRSGRRLDKSNDFLRLEIATALKSGIRVIPVLVQGATMPDLQDLPDDLKALARRQALELSDLCWSHDVGRLINILEQGLNKTLATKLVPKLKKKYTGVLSLLLQNFKLRLRESFSKVIRSRTIFWPSAIILISFVVLGIAIKLTLSLKSGVIRNSNISSQRNANVIKYIGN